MIIKLQDSYAIREKKKALKILREFKSNLPKGSEAIIAGGAPRDWHHGWGCRDIDIFYYIPEQKPLTHLSHRTNTQVPSHLDIPNLVTDEDANNHYSLLDSDNTGYGAILGIHEYQIKRKNAALNHRKVQLIELRIKPVDYIKLFPISISHIYMDTSGKIKSFEVYDISYESRIIYELHRKQWNYIYLDKILGRFSDYGFMPYMWQTRKKTAVARGITYQVA